MKISLRPALTALVLMMLGLIASAASAAPTTTQTAPSTAPTTPPPPAYPYPLDADGWMILKPGTFATRVYVSSSTGNDASLGDELHPVKTIAKAMRLIHPNEGDWIYLKYGDTFNEPIIGNISGGGPKAHAVITSYGDASLGRPKIVVKGTAQLSLFGSYIAVIDLEFDAGRDPSQPDFVLVPRGGGCSFRGHHIIFEGNKVTWGASSNLDIQPANGQPALKGVFIRRNVLAFAYSGGASFSQGLHTDGLDTPLIEGNFFHQNGWNPKVKLGTSAMFNHGCYNSWNVGAKNSYFRWNIFSNNASSGLQQRCGGVCHDNLFLNNGTAEDWTGQGESLYVDRNVSTTSLDCPTSIGPGTTPFYTGGGFQFNAFSGYMLNNIVCHGRPDAAAGAYQVSRNPRDVRANIPAENTIEVAGNITYDYFFDSLVYVAPEHPFVRFHDNITAKCQRKLANIRPTPAAPATALEGKILLENNLYDVDGKFWWQGSAMNLSQWSQTMKSTGEHVGTVNFVDPSRTIESYIVSQKLGKNYDDFVALALQQRKGHYNQALVAYSVNDYFFAGFTIAPPATTKPNR